MNTLQSSLDDVRASVETMLRSVQAASARWTTPRAPGKWSPSQVVEHVARSLEDSALDVRGEKSRLPSLPGPLRAVARGLLFRRVLTKETFPKAKTNPAMNPAEGPATPADAETRLRAALAALESSARAQKSGMATSRTFGSVPIADFVRFQALHVRHHDRQMGPPAA